MTATTNVENSRRHKSRFSLTVEQILAFASSTTMVREIKNLSPSFQISNKLRDDVLRY